MDVPECRGNAHWWRRMVYEGLMNWKCFEACGRSTCSHKSRRYAAKGQGQNAVRRKRELRAFNLWRRGLVRDERRSLDPISKNDDLILVIPANCVDQPAYVIELKHDVAPALERLRIRLIHHPRAHQVHARSPQLWSRCIITRQPRM